MQEAGAAQLADGSDYGVALLEVLWVGGDRAGQLALGEQGRVHGEDEAEHGALGRLVDLGGGLSRAFDNGLCRQRFLLSSWIW